MNLLNLYRKDIFFFSSSGQSKNLPSFDLTFRVTMSSASVRSYLSIDMGIRNLSCCYATFGASGAIPVIHAWDILDVLEMCGARCKNCNKLPIQRATTLMCDALNMYLSAPILAGKIDVHGIDRVLIEQQPVGFHRRSNTQMKVLSHVVQAFFHLRGIPVTFVSPKKKNLLSKEQSLRDGVASMNSSKRYQWHKKQSVLRCEEILASSSQREFLEFFEGLKKKDDCADSLLNAVAFHNG